MMNVPDCWYHAVEVTGKMGLLATPPARQA